MGGSYPAGMADDLDALRASCDRALGGHGPGRAADLLATIPPETAVDRYGDGGVVAELEAEVAELLGMPAAAYLPSGTMAQQAVLRVHAERRGRRTVLYHPMCHLDRHEGRALERLHGLVGRPVGADTRLIALQDLEQVPSRPPRWCWSCPQRDLGRPAAPVGGPAGAGRVGARDRRGGAPGRGAAVGGVRGLRPHAGGGRRAVRHGVRLLLQGDRRPGGLLPRRAGGRGGGGAGVAAPHGRHAVRLWPGAPQRCCGAAGADAGLPAARPGLADALRD
jgi:hypothetical protein